MRPTVEAALRETLGRDRRLLCLSVRVVRHESFDAIDRRVRSAVIDAGFRAAFTSVAGSVSSRTDAYLIPRDRVLRTEDVTAVARLLRGDDWYVFVQRIQAMVGIRVRYA